MPFKVTFPEPKFRRPDILRADPIPIHAYGLNPRSLFGERWWNIERKQAYVENNHYCWACGGYSGDDPMRPWLEGHERYWIDWENRLLFYFETAGVCVSCHMFIHNGKLFNQAWNGELSKEEVRKIIEPRIQLLNGERIPFFIRATKYFLEGYTTPVQHASCDGQEPGPPPKQYTEGGGWRLVVKGKIYTFEDIESGRYRHGRNRKKKRRKKT